MGKAYFKEFRLHGLSFYIKGPDECHDISNVAVKLGRIKLGSGTMFLYMLKYALIVG